MKIAERLGPRAALPEILERERKLLAEELHEGLCQDLCGISIHIKVLERRLLAEAPAFAEEFAALQEALEETIDSTWMLYQTLAPPIRDGQTLLEAIHEFAGAKGANFECTQQAHDSAKNLTAIQALALFRILQESVRDALSSDLPATLHFSLAVEEGRLCLSMVNRQASGQSRNNLVLEVMEAQAASINAELSFSDCSGSETTIRCRLPQ